MYELLKIIRDCFIMLYSYLLLLVISYESTLGERTEAISADSVRTAGEPTVGERMPPPNT